MNETCIMCGETIPEGRQVCPICERGERRRMTIDENKFIAEVEEWAVKFKFLSADKVIEILRNSEVKMEKTICPRCQGIYLKRVHQCPLCGYKPIEK